MQGVGLTFTNGGSTPFFERKSYGNALSDKQTLQLNLEVTYNRIYIKVAGSGDDSIITGLRIGTTNSSSLHYEWKKQGAW